MTRKEAMRQADQQNLLMALGFTASEAESLRRISMTLQRWYEKECGGANEYGSWSIERDGNGDGPPFMVHHHYRHGDGKDYVTRTKIADREAGAVKRLKVIVSARNQRVITATPEPATIQGNIDNAIALSIGYYLQTDPRGASLYIIRPGDVPEGADVSGYYNRGICVY